MSHPETKNSNMGLNRREFLKVAGVLGAGLAIAPTVLSEEAKNASKTVNVGFIGVGTEGASCGGNPNQSVGDNAYCGADNGDVTIPAFARIYVR